MDRQLGRGPDESSRDLVLRVQSGDAQALEHLVGRYLPRLRRWARGRLPRWARDRFDTEDVVQETLIQTIGQIPSFEVRPDAGFHSYVRQALLNRIRAEVRRARRRPGFDELTEAKAGDEPSPLDEAIGREALHRYETALVQLKDGDREAIVARVEMACSYREIATILDKPSEDAARMAVGRALLRLAQEMTRVR